MRGSLRGRAVRVSAGFGRRSRGVALACAAVGLFGDGAAWAAIAAPSERFRLAGTVTRVMEPGVVAVRMANGRAIHVQLLGIDAPGRGECYFQEALAATRRFAERRRVTLRADGARPIRGPRGRLLTYVETRGSADLGFALLRNGYAKIDRRRRFSRLEAYRRAETAGRQLPKSVWRCGAVSPPPAPAPPPPPAAVILENLRAGTPGWASVAVAPPGAIEGYTAPSATPGDTVTFHVAADPAESYRILLYRIGYYGGAGARLMTCLPSCDGSARAEPQSLPPPDPEGLVHAGWPAGQRLQIPLDWISGYYLVRFVLTSGRHAGTGTVTWLIVREPPGAPKTPILVQAPPTTWQAYNGWGGGSLYEYNSPGERRAAKVAFDRPYRWESAGGLLMWDLPLVRFLERNGYDVSYQADVDTARFPESLAGRKAVLVAGHGEYWAKEVRDGFDRARAVGTNLAFFGANAAYWQVRYEDDYRTIVGYKSSSWDPESDPWRETDVFRALVPPRYECELMGIQHQGGTLDWTTDGDYVVTEAAAADSWLQAGGFRPGDVVRGVVSREVDTIPPHQTAADSCGNRLTVLFHRELGGDTLGNADAVRFTAPSGAIVFSSGSHQFAWGLESVPEVADVPGGLVDARLQRFVQAMLDEMLR